MPTKKSTTKTAKKSSATKTPPKQSAVKKTVKKAAKKSSAPSKTSTKKAVKQLVHADSDQAFWVCNGDVLSNLAELKEALDAMSDKVFSHHVTKDKNDFADWVEWVLADPDCATALRKSKKPKAAKTIVVRHLKVYSL